MQSLWSRAAQAQSCTCRACAHVSNAAIRRTTTAAVGRRRRRPGFSDVFTAFYTTVLGTAAVLDARYKDGRRKRLDREIEEARRGLAQLREASSGGRQGHQEHPRPALMRLPVPLSAIEALKSICKTENALSRHNESKRQLLRFLRKIHRSHDPEERLGNRYAEYLGANLDAIDAAIQQEAKDGTLLQRDPLTNVQFERYHDMINRMVDKLIIQSYYDELPQDPERARRNLDSLDSAWTAIRMLRSEGYPRYRHPSVDPHAARQQRDQLTDMLQRLFDEWGTDRRKAKPKFQVAKICYNLLVCPFPPSIHHYNMLLLGFARKKAHSLNDMVVESLLEDSRLHPTTQTIVCLLLHYRQKRDIHGFYNIIRRMMAIDNRGMLVRRRWYEDVVKTPALHPWARSPEVTPSLKANWIIERPARSQDIYEALISGLLSFNRVKDAVKVFVGSLQERLGTSVELFIYLLKSCLYRLDASAADILLRGLIDNAGVMVSLMLRSDCPRRLAEHLYPILNLGKPPSWPFSKERAKVMWTSRTMATSPEDLGRIRLLTTAMFIRQTETQLSRLSHVLRRTRLMLHADYPEARTVIALCGISELNEIKRHHGYLAGRLLKHQALLKVARAVEGSTWDVEPGKINSLYLRVVPLLERSLRLAKAGGYERTDRMDEVNEIADEWFQHRISRLQGTRSYVKQLMIEAELRLFMGCRLDADVRRLLPEELEWRLLDLSMSEEVVDEGQGDDGQAPDAGGLWPKAEMDAVRAAVPGSSAERLG